MNLRKWVWGEKKKKILVNNSPGPPPFDGLCRHQSQFEKGLTSPHSPVHKREVANKQTYNGIGRGTVLHTSMGHIYQIVKECDIEGNGYGTWRKGIKWW